MPERMQEAADVFRRELVKGEAVRNAPWVISLGLLGGECDVLHFAVQNLR